MTDIEIHPKFDEDEDEYEEEGENKEEQFKLSDEERLFVADIFMKMPKYKGMTKNSRQAYFNTIISLYEKLGQTPKALIEGNDDEISEKITNAVFTIHQPKPTYLTLQSRRFIEFYLFLIQDMSNIGKTKYQVGFEEFCRSELVQAQLAKLYKEEEIKTGTPPIFNENDLQVPFAAPIRRFQNVLEPPVKKRKRPSSKKKEASSKKEESNAPDDNSDTEAIHALHKSQKR